MARTLIRCAPRGLGGSGRCTCRCMASALSCRAVMLEPLPYTLCFITRGSHLLLLERRREPNLGLWNGVGGKLEPGEAPHDSIRREIREETGLELTDVRFSGVVTWYENGRLRAGAYTYVATLPEGAPYETPRETDEGVLDWKERAWALDPTNERIAVTARRFLAQVLDDP